MRSVVTILIFGTILAFVIGVVYFVLSSVAKVGFEVTFKNLDINPSLDNLIDGQVTAKVKVGCKITNRNDFSIKLSDFHIWIYFKDVLVAQTAATETNLSKVNIPANGLVDVTHDVNVILNKTMIDVLKDYANKQEIKFDYVTEFKVYGIKYTYKDYFTFKR